MNLFENVKVVIFEEMVKDIKGYIENGLYQFLNIDPEVAISHFADMQENKRHTKGSIFAERMIRKSLAFLNLLGSPQKIIPSAKRENL